MEVRNLVGDETVWIEPTNTMREATYLMASHDIGALPVEIDGDLVGILTERDVLNACAEGADFASSPVRTWMTPDPDTLEPDTSAEEAATWMLAAGYRHLPVLDGARVIGVVSIKDVLWALTGTILT